MEDTRRHFDVIAERIDKKVEETRSHFDVIAERIDKKVDLLAEVVASLREDFRGEIDELRDETRRGFAETQAMIKFSHAELDRRVRALEQAMADLQSRVERLESSTH
ncbi:MAG TPA: hypothetical protein VNL91_09865 [Thermoanaerobaculia bacterium]|nr:hypothetical protein [Thermoanaerobaculia bacterium]